MSLKAKIEAVIYASEEPVTLPQLIGLLGVEAQAELDALDARQGSLLPLDMPPRPGPLDSREPDTDHDLDLDGLNAETLSGSADEDPSPTSENEETASPENAVEDPADAPAASPEETSSAPAAETLPDTARKDDSQLKREARERDRRLRDYFRDLLDRLTAEYAQGDRGLEIREIAGGFRFSTKPEFHDTVRGFVRSLKPPLKLSLQALETLAVVAYKQPVTAPEIGEIRGVDSGGVLGSLIARKLITTAGRKQVIGRPILYKTTKEFLLRFGLKDANELPSIEEFERLAGELTEAVQEEIDMDQGAARRAEEAIADENASEPVENGSAGNDRTATSAAEDAQLEVEATRPSPAAAKDVEPMRDVHEAQADGIPENSSETNS